MLYVRLFGDNFLSTLKEMGDINKYPVGTFRVPSNQFNSGNVPYLNFGGPVPGVRGGQGFRGQFPRGGRGQISRCPKLMIPPQYPPRLFM